MKKCGIKEIVVIYKGGNKVRRKRSCWRYWEVWLGGGIGGRKGGVLFKLCGICFGVKSKGV